jgi:phosphate/phosphite/phosphonate ABC transporter binding protein
MADDDSLPNERRRPERTLIVPAERTLAGKYRLERLIGEGGMGSVYEAEHLGLGKKVAVKLLAESFSENTIFLHRFRREARAMAAVHHDNIVDVTDTGTDEEGVPFLVMELLDGESLASVLRRAKWLTPESAAGIAWQMLAGLAAAHAAGIVHRDLKPANVFLVTTREGHQRVKILDFGISKFARDESAYVTIEGAVIGTPSFMAPEQVKAEHDVDRRADLYAVGVMLYRMVTGKLPFNATTNKEIYERILDGRAPLPRSIRPEIDETFEGVIMKAFALDREDRYQSAEEFQEALGRAVPELEKTNPVPVFTRNSITGDSRASDIPVVDAALRSSQPEESVDRTRNERARRGRQSSAPSPIIAPAPPKPRNSLWPFVALAVIGIVAAIGFAVYAATQTGGVVATEGDDDPATPAGDPPAGEPFRYAVARYAERESVLADHEPLGRYLEQRLGRPVELLIVEPHELIPKLERGDVDMAALSPARYIEAKNRVEGLRLVATAVNAGGPTYEGIVIARADSGINALTDFRGKTFCFVDESSSSGYLYPRALFRQAGMDPDHDFSATRFTSDHSTSVRLVASGVCDGAAVYQSILYGSQEEHPIQMFRQVASTPRIPYDAYVVAGRASPAIVAEIEEALLALAPGTPAAAQNLDRSRDLRGFQRGDDRLYDGAREVVRYLDEHQNH